MLARLKDYAPIIGEEEVERIREEASELGGHSLVHVNSTFYGGGVAEMLNSAVPLMNDAGVQAEWRLIKGGRDFFLITKKMHNSLQGAKGSLTAEEREIFEETIGQNARFMNLEWYDCVVIDDPQPVPLIGHYSRKTPSLWKPLPALLQMQSFQKRQRWVWRCHIDLSRPNPRSLAYLKSFVRRYDGVIVSHKSYRTGMRMPHWVVAPAIDPLSDKNRELGSREHERVLAKYGIGTGIPIIAQVSRFDQWKDPLGVIEAFKKVRRDFRCQLVLLGNFASDDPEGEVIYKKVVGEAERERDITVISVQSDLLVNALQREAAVVLQKSLREGFGLTVSEALWKGTPVVASRVGGIALQVENGRSGFLVDSVEECAQRTLWLLKNPEKARVMGARGRERVKRKFLMTRLVRDEIRVAKELLLPRRVGIPEANRMLSRTMRTALRLPKKSAVKMLSLMGALAKAAIKK